MDSIMTYSTPDMIEWPPIRVYDTDFRKPLKEMADTVDRLELWNWFKNESPPDDLGYSFWKHENIKMITRFIIDGSYRGYHLSINPKLNSFFKHASSVRNFLIFIKAKLD